MSAKVAGRRKATLEVRQARPADAPGIVVAGVTIDAASVPEIRVMRDDCREEEARLSYARRVIHGQLDIVPAPASATQAPAPNDRAAESESHGARDSPPLHQEPEPRPAARRSWLPRPRPQSRRRRTSSWAATHATCCPTSATARCR